MAACGSLQHIFDNPLPESPKTIFDSLSPWNHLDHRGAAADNSPPSSSSFSELFGELHFKDERRPESSVSQPSSPPFSSSSSSPSSLSSSSLSSSVLTDLCPPPPQKIHYRSTDRAKDYYGGGFSAAMNSESLSMCTEGLGFESFYDVEELNGNDGWDSTWHHRERRRRRSISFCPKYTQHQDYYFSGEAGRRSRINGVEFPPPISSIGWNGKPGVCFRSYRSNGRFILKEVRIPVQEFLHACREDGRLKLRLIQSDEEPFEDDDDYDDDNEEEETGANGEVINGEPDEHDEYDDEKEGEVNGDGKDHEN